MLHDSSRQLRVHAQLTFVGSATTTAVLDISDHVWLILELGHFFRSESERQPLFNVSLLPGTPLLITDVNGIAPRLSFHEYAAVLKNLTIELVLPFPKGSTPFFHILFSLGTSAWKEAWRTKQHTDAKQVEATRVPEIPN
jgi:hypothetical protein